MLGRIYSIGKRLDFLNHMATIALLLWNETCHFCDIKFQTYRRAPRISMLDWLFVFVAYAVALARMLFPMEARVAMDIAQVDGTLEFTLGSTQDHSTQKSTAVDLNETPFKIKEEHLSRIKALSRTGNVVASSCESGAIYVSMMHERCF